MPGAFVPPMLKSKSKRYFLTLFSFPTLKCPFKSVEQVQSRVARVGGSVGPFTLPLTGSGPRLSLHGGWKGNFPPLFSFNPYSLIVF